MWLAPEPGRLEQHDTDQPLPNVPRNLSMSCCGQLNPGYVDIIEEPSRFFISDGRKSDKVNGEVAVLSK